MYETKCPICCGRKALKMSFYFKELVCKDCADKARSEDRVLKDFHEGVKPIWNESNCNLSIEK